MTRSGETCLESVDLFAKLEFYNPTGSIKDRPAAYIVRHLLQSGKIKQGSTVIESSSGNFGIALAAVCRAEGINFTCVVDPGILPENEFLLKQYRANVVKITEKDDTGGYLKNRIAFIEKQVKECPDIHWFNQYENQMNAEAHYFGTGMEIYKTFSDYGLDYVFVAVGSGGTIAGISRLLKEQFPSINVVAVDAAGSVIFGGKPKPRFVPGMGSSIRPALVDSAQIDYVETVEEAVCVNGCAELLEQHGLFVGGSSGGVYEAAKSFFKTKAMSFNSSEPRKRPKALLLFPDRGERYRSTVFNPEWVHKKFKCERDPKESTELLNTALQDT